MVEIWPRVVVPPGTTRVLGVRLLGGEVDYELRCRFRGRVGQGGGALLVVLALLAGSGVLQIGRPDARRLAVAGACAVMLGCVALWPLAAPVGVRWRSWSSLAEP